MTVAITINYFYLVAFGWMVMEGVMLYLKVVKVFNVTTNKKYFYGFAWGKNVTNFCSLVYLSAWIHWCKWDFTILIHKKYVFLFISLFVFPLPFAGFPTFLVAIAVALNTLIHGNMDDSIRNDVYVTKKKTKIKLNIILRNIFFVGVLSAWQIRCRYVLGRDYFGNDVDHVT